VFVISNQQGAAISVNKETQTLPYCLLGSTVEYGDPCLPPPPPPARKLTGEQGVALATGLIIILAIFVLAADTVYRKVNGHGGHGGGGSGGGGGKELAELEMRNRKEREDGHESKGMTASHHTHTDLNEEAP